MTWSVSGCFESVANAASSTSLIDKRRSTGPTCVSGRKDVSDTEVAVVLGAEHFHARKAPEERLEPSVRNNRVVTSLSRPPSLGGVVNGEVVGDYGCREEVSVAGSTRGRSASGGTHTQILSRGREEVPAGADPRGLDAPDLI